jgi:hypothetical protein
MRLLAVPLLLVAACGEDETYLTVTVTSRPAVHDAKSLKVTLSNAGSMYTDDLDLGDRPFPVTFTLSAPGRSGELDISIDALDSAETLVGRGVGTTNLDEMTASVTLDSADFVVNTDYANDQFLTTDFEAVGFQLAASANTWTATFRDECTTSTSCEIYGRRFDSNGLPVFSMLAAGDIQFKLTTAPTQSGAMPAIAATTGAAPKTLAFWDFTESSGGGRGVACRALDSTGAAAVGQQVISTDPADVVSATGLPTGDFAVTWQVFETPSYVVKRIIVDGSCAIVAPTAPLSITLGSFGAKRAAVTANTTAVLYSWIVDDNLWVRTSTMNGTLGPEVRLTDVTTGSPQTVEHVRVTPWRDGFAIAVRWASRQTDGPGKIELYRTNAAGVLQGTPILITDASRADFASNKGFSIARRPDDALMVVWHVCETGPGLCDVFGRVLRPTGAAVGEPFVLPTSTASEQINPSVIGLADSFVAAWNDSSGESPDRSGTAVRARVITPLYDDARGVHGATCGASAPGAPDCDEGLACAMGSDTIQRCYYVCESTCPTGGTCTQIDPAVSACTF